MNAQILLRFIWKECRQLVPINLAILVVGSMIGMGLSLIGDEHYWVRGLISGIFFSIPVIALVNGVLAFSPENDNRTIRFLQTLPISGRKLAGMKLVAVAAPLLVFGLLSTVFLFGDWVWEVPYVIDSMPPNFTASDWYLTAASTWWLMFVAACIASIFLRHSIFALCATPVIVLAISLLISLTSMPFSTPGDFFGLYFAAACRVALLAIGAIWISVTLGDRWLRDDPWIAGNKRSRQTPGGATRTTSKPEFGGGQFQRLFWQSCRVSAWPILVYLIGFAVLSLILQITPKTTSWDVTNETDSVFAFLLLALQFAPVVFAGLAATIFWPDQRRRSYQFFQQHPLIHLKLWIARIAPWFIAALIAAGIMVLVYQVALVVFRDDFRATNESLGFELRNGENWVFQIASSGAVTSALLFVFAVGFGQLFSIFFRSPILAFFCATACELFLLGFSWYLTRLGTSPALILLIPIVILFSAGLWLLPKWINERLFTRHRLAVIAFGIIGLAAAIGVLAGLRSTEISRLTIINPNLPPPPEIAALLAEPKVVPPERAELIRNLQTLDPIPFAKWMAELIASLQDKSPAYVHGIFTYWSGSLPNPIESPIDVVGNAFDANLASGNLEEAGRNLSCLAFLNNISSSYGGQLPSGRWVGQAVLWAEANGQSAAAIRNFIKELESQPELFSQVSLLSASQELEQLSPLGFRHYDGPRSFLIGDSWSGIQELDLFGKMMPWEISRTRRLLRLKLNAAAWHWRQMYRLSWQDNSCRIALRASQDPILAATPPFRYQDLDFQNYRNLEASSPYFFNDLFWQSKIERRIQERRFVMIRLAIVSYKLETGKYPDSLDILEPYFLNGLPNDGMNGASFVYYPNGIENTLWNETAQKFTYTRTDAKGISQNIPFVLPTSQPIVQKTQSNTQRNTPGTASYFISDSATQSSMMWDWYWRKELFEYCKLPFVKE